MADTIVQKMYKYGQSVWMGHISRALLSNGALAKYSSDGLGGAILDLKKIGEVIQNDSTYDTQIKSLSSHGYDSQSIADALIIADLKECAQIFLPLYTATRGLDGYVGCNLNPHFLDNPESLIHEAQRVLSSVKSPNIILNIPACDKMYRAIRSLISLGHAVNVTHIYSVVQYEKVAHVYIEGVKNFIASGGDSASLRSVASVSLSGIDVFVDAHLQEMIKNAVSEKEKEHLLFLKGQAARANCQTLYAKHFEIFSERDFQKLYDQGARFQRIMWDTEGTDAHRYAREVIAKNTINKMDEDTFVNFLTFDTIPPTLSHEADEAKELFNEFYKARIDIDELCLDLSSGVRQSLDDEYAFLLRTISEKVIKDT
jgi:transaldolase